ncbi:hypothetical protein PVAP13_9NG244173 [Panicum virgatum]|uniref:Uncharacterized protein n=1 Tax=Panicum virgatum TaxID=38727 RepID=A0A8T0MQN1_PANVG|nr:hypothetical protein PVAP13_9NG244173 [Panicum virgatum]
MPSEFFLPLLPLPSRLLRSPVRIARAVLLTAAPACSALGPRPARPRAAPHPRPHAPSPHSPPRAALRARSGRPTRRPSEGAVEEALAPAGRHAGPARARSRRRPGACGRSSSSICSLLASWSWSLDLSADSRDGEATAPTEAASEARAE